MYIIVLPDGELARPAVFTESWTAETFRKAEGITGAVMPVLVDPVPRPCHTTRHPDSG